MHFTFLPTPNAQKGKPTYHVVLFGLDLAYHIFICMNKREYVQGSVSCAILTIAKNDSLDRRAHGLSLKLK